MKFDVIGSFIIGIILLILGLMLMFNPGPNKPTSRPVEECNDTLTITKDDKVTINDSTLAKFYDLLGY